MLPSTSKESSFEVTIEYYWQKWADSFKRPSYRFRKQPLEFEKRKFRRLNPEIQSIMEDFVDLKKPCPEYPKDLDKTQLMPYFEMLNKQIFCPSSGSSILEKSHTISALAAKIIFQKPKELSALFLKEQLLPALYRNNSLSVYRLFEENCPNFHQLLDLKLCLPEGYDYQLYLNATDEEIIALLLDAAQLGPLFVDKLSRVFFQRLIPLISKMQEKDLSLLRNRLHLHLTESTNSTSTFHFNQPLPICKNTLASQVILALIESRNSVPPDLLKQIFEQKDPLFYLDFCFAIDPASTLRFCFLNQKHLSQLSDSCKEKSVFLPLINFIFYLEPSWPFRDPLIFPKAVFLSLDEKARQSIVKFRISNLDVFHYLLRVPQPNFLKMIQLSNFTHKEFLNLSIYDKNFSLQFLTDLGNFLNLNEYDLVQGILEHTEDTHLDKLKELASFFPVLNLRTNGGGFLFEKLADSAISEHPTASHIMSCCLNIDSSDRDKVEKITQAVNTGLLQLDTTHYYQNVLVEMNKSVRFRDGMERFFYPFIRENQQKFSSNFLIHMPFAFEPENFILNILSQSGKLEATRIFSQKISFLGKNRTIFEHFESKELEPSILKLKLIEKIIELYGDIGCILLFYETPDSIHQNLLPIVSIHFPHLLPYIDPLIRKNNGFFEETISFGGQKCSIRNFLKVAPQQAKIVKEKFIQEISKNYGDLGLLFLINIQPDLLLENVLSLVPFYPSHLLPATLNLFPKEKRDHFLRFEYRNALIPHLHKTHSSIQSFFFENRENWLFPKPVDIKALLTESAYKSPIEQLEILSTAIQNYLMEIDFLEKQSRILPSNFRVTIDEFHKTRSQKQSFIDLQKRFPEENTEILCPLSAELLTDPVLLSTCPQHTVSRSFASKLTSCPFTRQTPVTLLEPSEERKKNLSITIEKHSESVQQFIQELTGGNKRKRF